MRMISNGGVVEQDSNLTLLPNRMAKHFGDGNRRPWSCKPDINRPPVTAAKR